MKKLIFLMMIMLSLSGCTTSKIAVFKAEKNLANDVALIANAKLDKEVSQGQLTAFECEKMKEGVTVMESLIVMRADEKIEALEKEPNFYDYFEIVLKLFI